MESRCECIARGSGCGTGIICCRDPKLTVGTDYFQLDGKPLPVVGTTYMSSDVSRMYLMQPNAYVWDQRHGADSRRGAEHDPDRIVDDVEAQSWRRMDR